MKDTALQMSCLVNDYESTLVNFLFGIYMYFIVSINPLLWLYFIDSVEISNSRRNVRPISIELIDLRSYRVSILFHQFKNQPT